MSNLADSGSNDSDSNGDFEQLPLVSIPPQASTQPPSTTSDRGETNLSVSPRASPPVTLSHSMSSETYLQSELGATAKREADSSAPACGCCCFCMLHSIYLTYYSPAPNCLLCQTAWKTIHIRFLLFLTPLAACVTNMDPRGMFT